MENFQYDILEELLLRYSATETDLSRFVEEKLGVKSNDLVKTQHVRSALVDLESRGLINWKVDKKTVKDGQPATYHWDNPQFKIDFGETVNGENQTFSNNRVEARLTPQAGLDYAMSIVRGRQIHESTLSTNRRMIWLTAAITLLTIVTLGIQIYDATRPDPEVNWDRLIESQRALGDSIGTDLKRINSTLEKIARDSAEMK